ncbi:MAG TPA: FAD:protein FMN transferase [Gaiellales bacterium]|jgi:thiamine biosynthesis lipoprotein
MAARLDTLPFRAMGTACAVSVTMSSEERLHARRAMDAGRAEVVACELVLSRFDPQSDLSRLNSLNGEWVPVDGRLLAALDAALRAREVTGGRFDPTILPALVAAGYDRSFEQVTPRAPRVVRGWRAGAGIEVDNSRRRARIQAGAAIDLGGIGKGFSADRALQAMRAAWPGLRGGLVDLGGDIAVWGASPDGARWRVGVADPREPGASLGVLRIAAGGVATSGRDQRRFGLQNELHHLIDPSTGAPARGGPLAVTVVAADAAAAEAHATALAVTAARAARAYIAERPGLGALVVPETGGPVMAGELEFAAHRTRVRLTLPTT